MFSSEMDPEGFALTRGEMLQSNVFVLTQKTKQCSKWPFFSRGREVLQVNGFALEGARNALQKKTVLLFLQGMAIAATISL